MIIAEIGQNHCGKMSLARDLIRLAKLKGADLVKFQLYDSKKYYGEAGHSELSKEQAFELFNYGKEAGIGVFFSVYDTDRIGWCEEMGVTRYKVASCFNHHQPVIDGIVKTGKEFFISLYKGAYIPKGSKARLLYCVPLYPAPLEKLQFIGVDFNAFDGFSDHTIGLDAAKIAIVMGAKIIEKHFAIDHKTGVDAEWSMTPNELAELRRFYDVAQACL